MDLKQREDSKKCIQYHNTLYNLQSAMCGRWVQRDINEEKSQRNVYNTRMLYITYTLQCVEEGYKWI